MILKAFTGLMSAMLLMASDVAASEGYAEPRGFSTFVPAWGPPMESSRSEFPGRGVR